MISFQRLLGREDEFCDLLEASAQEACHAVDALKKVLMQHEQSPMMAEFADARSKDKRITEEISERLITTFVTPMEREDIEALAEALYKVPKIAVKLVLQMVQTIRAGRDLSDIKQLQRQLQAAESEADGVLLKLEQQFYEPGFPPLKAIILKDLFALNEKVVDRCRDAGNVISHVLLKNS
jgi:uncharacterized protein